MNFSHCNHDEKYLTLHDCIAERAYFENGKLGFEFNDGFWISPDHPESNLSNLVRTDFSKVEYKLEDGADYDVTIYVFKKNLFNKMRNDRYHGFTTKVVRIILVAAILVALLLSAFVFPSSRESALSNLNAFSKFKITEDNKNSVNGEIKVGYIPEGFELVENHTAGKQTICKYKSNSEEMCTIWKCTSSMEMNFDTENFITEEIFVDNMKYTYCQGNEGMNTLIWTRNDYIYQLEAQFEKEDMVKIAKFVN